MKKRLQRLQRYAILPRRRAPNLPPGSLEPSHDALAPTFHVMAYGPEGYAEHTPDNADELEQLRAEAPVLWVNVDGLADIEAFRSLGAQFGLHMLALEDVVNVPQRPKAEDYGTHAYVVLPMPDGKGGLEQASLFIGKDFVITVQERSGDCLEPLRERIRQSLGRVRRSGADYLAYAVLDAMLNSYFPQVDQLSERLEGLEARLIQGDVEDPVPEIYAVRQRLHVLRRVLRPCREAIGQLARGEILVIGKHPRLYLRDCQDLTAQLLDAVEACRELSAGLMELHSSAQSNRMNEVMKVLTLIATIFIPLSFIAGVYGMNFDTTASPWNMPELRWAWGYPAALSFMLLTGVSFLVFFRRRGWLGGAAKR